MKPYTKSHVKGHVVYPPPDTLNPVTTDIWIVTAGYFMRGPRYTGAYDRGPAYERGDKRHSSGSFSITISSLLPRMLGERHRSGDRAGRVRGERGDPRCFS